MNAWFYVYTCIYVHGQVCMYACMCVFMGELSQTTRSKPNKPLYTIVIFDVSLAQQCLVIHETTPTTEIAEGYYVYWDYWGY